MLYYLILFLGVINLIRMIGLTVVALYYGRFMDRNWLVHNTPQQERGKYKYRPKFSIIIPAFNEEKGISRTLTALSNQTYRKFEIIIVNDGSRDSTEKMVIEYALSHPTLPISYVYQHNSGKAHALNNALKNYASGKLIMCLDADTVLKPDALEQSAKYFRNRKIKAIASNVKLTNSGSLVGAIQRLEYLLGFHLKRALTVGNMEYILGGAGSIFRASILKRVGYYDTDTITEDIDLTLKILELGNNNNRILYAQDVVAYTEGPLTLYALFRQRYRWKYGRFQAFWKHRTLLMRRSQKHSFTLTMIYLPFQMFSEFISLFDPLLLLFIIYIAFNSSDPSTFYNMIIFVMFFLTFAVVLDKESSIREKIVMLVLSPLAYFMFFIVSIVEYFGLIKSLLNWKGILSAEERQVCGWVPVERSGKEMIGSR